MCVCVQAGTSMLLCSHGTTNHHLNRWDFPMRKREDKHVIDISYQARLLECVRVFVCVQYTLVFVCALAWELLCHSDPCQGLKPSPRQVRQQNSYNSRSLFQQQDMDWHRERRSAGSVPAHWYINIFLQSRGSRAGCQHRTSLPFHSVHIKANTDEIQHDAACLTDLHHHVTNVTQLSHTPLLMYFKTKSQTTTHTNTHIQAHITESERAGFVPSLLHVSREEWVET